MSTTPLPTQLLTQISSFDADRVGYECDQIAQIGFFDHNREIVLTVDWHQTSAFPVFGFGNMYFLVHDRTITFKNLLALFGFCGRSSVPLDQEVRTVGLCQFDIHSDL
jgi:hypothetical protein